MFNKYSFEEAISEVGGFLTEDSNGLGINHYVNSRDGYFRHVCSRKDGHDMVDLIESFYRTGNKDKASFWFDKDTGKFIVTYDNVYREDGFFRYGDEHNCPHALVMGTDWKAIDALGISSRLYGK